MSRRTVFLALAAIAVAGCGAAEAENPAGGTWPQLHPPRDARTVVWAVGDGADGGSAGKKVARRIARGKPDWLLYLGDVYEGTSLSQYRAKYGSVFGRFARITAPTPGNHEWPSHRSGYDRYWKRVRKTKPPAYYSFSLSGWRIFSLNSEVAHGSGSKQVEWLRRELRKRSGTCAIAFWHRPRYSAGFHGDQPDVAPFWRALKGHARLVLNGHDHDMQRFSRRGGIVELVAGAGGHPRYPVDRRHTGLAFADASHFGAVRLVLRRGRASFAFVSSGGRKLDSGHVNCRPAATT
jgi:hypothetical protein